MKRTFIDTNYFLRFLIKDGETKQQEQVVRLFNQAADGQVKLFTSSIVIFEIFWVLTSFYEKEKQEVIQILQDVLQLSFIELEERDILQEALQLFGNQAVELEDCYNLIYAKEEEMSEFRTFDEKLQKVVSQLS